MEDLLNEAIKYATKLGASYAEARYQKDVREGSLLKNGVPELSAVQTIQGISVRVVVDKALGFASTDSMTKKAVRKAVMQAFQLARSSSRFLKKGVEMAEAEVGKAKVEVKPRIPFEDVDADSRVDYLKEADREAVEVAEKRGIKLVSRFLNVSSWNTEKRIINTDGADVYSYIPRSTLFCVVTAFHQQKGTVQRFINMGESRGWESVERYDLTGVLTKETETLSNILLEAKEPPKDRVDVILGPEIVGLVCHESAGHPGEADRMLGREAAQAGETYIKPELLGTRIGSEKVTIVDNPALPKSFGYYEYDDEGVKVRERVLIKEGVLNELLHNRETAAQLNTRSNGASRSNQYDREPIVRMANTYMLPGDHSLEELVEGIKKGVYVKSYQEWNIDDKRWNQRYVGVEAYLIEEGEIKGMVRNPVVELTTKGLYSAVDALSDDLEFFAGYCGKGDPPQGIPVWFGGPHARLRDVYIGFRQPS